MKTILISALLIIHPMIYANNNPKKCPKSSSSTTEKRDNKWAKPLNVEPMKLDIKCVMGTRQYITSKGAYINIKCVAPWNVVCIYVYRCNEDFGNDDGFGNSLINSSTVQLMVPIDPSKNYVGIPEINGIRFYEATNISIDENTTDELMFNVSPNFTNE